MSVLLLGTTGALLVGLDVDSAGLLRLDDRVRMMAQTELLTSEAPEDIFS